MYVGMRMGGGLHVMSGSLPWVTVRAARIIAAMVALIS